jgi:hypothetical protein
MITNILVLVQVGWFSLQCVSRSIEDHQITKLELLTIGYVLMTLAIYIAWWDKPRRLNRSINVAETAPTRALTQERWIGVPLNEYMGFPTNHFATRSKRIPLFYSGNRRVKDASVASHIAMLFGCAFGGIMCIGWGSTSSDSITIDLVLWRLCALEILQSYIFGFIASPFYYPNKTHYGYTAPKWCIQLASLWVMLLHILTRITAIFIAIRELQITPGGVYAKLNWISYIPHI